MRWQPWQTLLRRAAAAQGFLDPLTLLGQLRQFAQPGEVEHPVELLRAGAVMHARGLLNARVIQHNLDWHWPWWVRRQYDPRDAAFTSRGFSLTHINGSWRSWSAIGLPDVDANPVVDPAGLLTPNWDGWSLDVWAVGDDGAWLVPATVETRAQRLDMQPGCAVVTRSHLDATLVLETRAECVWLDDAPCWTLDCALETRAGAWLVAALRPFNPEGVSFVSRVALVGDSWQVNGDTAVRFSATPSRHAVSCYGDGDVAARWDDARAWRREVTCAQGMASAAAGVRVAAGAAGTLRLSGKLRAATPSAPRLDWPDALAGLCTLDAPDERYVQLFEAARRTLVLLAPQDVYPGPYTYRRFWFRDAVFMLDAMLAIGLHARAARVIERFHLRQTAQGYFHSQNGEWDANGAVLWLLERQRALSAGRAPAPDTNMLRRAARWIGAKLEPHTPVSPHAGLMPAGFSAEHLGPNDYYYWDDFWSLAGLRAAAALLADGDARAAAASAARADTLEQSIAHSLELCAERLGRAAMPASPYRRLDSAAVGCLVAGHPLQLMAARDARLLDTAEYLLEHCLVDGALFHDVVHAGLNPYLTLHLAQVLMRAGDARHGELVAAVAALASPTGHWPEAVHPATGGGCMGDGQHGWAAAEWLLCMRDSFVREEGAGLVLGAGIPPTWLELGATARLGPVHTRHGVVTVTVSGAGDGPSLALEARWQGTPPPLEVALPGHVPVRLSPDAPRVRLTRSSACAS